MQSIILQPVVALMCWTLIIWVWMYAKRLPAVIKARVNFDQVKNGAQLRQVLPERVNWVADNYNHLLEQPVVFYATCMTLAILNSNDSVNVYLAWAYVFLRVLHSLWQALVNIVTLRFILFTLSTLVLMVLCFRTVILIW